MIPYEIKLEDLIEKLKKREKFVEKLKKIGKLLPASMSLTENPSKKRYGIAVRKYLFSGDVTLTFFTNNLTIYDLKEIEEGLNDILAPYNIVVSATKYISGNKEELLLYLQVLRNDVKLIDVADTIIELINYAKRKHS